MSATHAALLLAQGAGRLIRTSEDRGVVAVLDPRLATARYGELPDPLAAGRSGGRRTVRSAISALQRLAAPG